MRIAAGLLMCAAAVMVVAAFVTGDEQRGPANAAAPAPAAPRDGRAVWAEHGCGSCHAFAPASARGQFGPDLDQSLRSMPDRYIRESIVAPDRVIAPDHAGGIMPADYGQRIPAADLERLVEFISTGVRD